MDECTLRIIKQLISDRIVSDGPVNRKRPEELQITGYQVVGFKTPTVWILNTSHRLTDVHGVNGISLTTEEMLYDAWVIRENEGYLKIEMRYQGSRWVFPCPR